MGKRKSEFSNERRTTQDVRPLKTFGFQAVPETAKRPSLPKQDFTPRITEYKGVVYRSKSEAMFARWLELAYGDEIGSGFIYEPKGYSVGRWNPDFLLWFVTNPKSNPHSELNFPVIYRSIIEYKPSIPTETYVQEFYNRCSNIIAKFKSSGVAEISSFDFTLCYGSVYSKNRGYFEFWPWSKDVGGCHFATDWLENYEQKIRATRFDLESK